MDYFSIEKSDELLNKAGTLFFKSPDKCLELADEAMRISKKIKDDIGISMAFMHFGLGYYYKGDYKQAVDSYDKALKISRKINFFRGTCRILLNLGAVYSQTYQIEKALKCFFEVLEIDKKSEKKSDSALALNNIGNIYKKKNEDNKALKFYKQSLQVSECINFKNGITNSLTNIGHIYLRKKEYTKAKTYFKKSLPICQETSNYGVLIPTYINLAEILKHEHQFERSLKILKKALPLAEELKNIKKTIQIQIEIAGLEIYLNQYDIAENKLLEIKKIAEEEKAEVLSEHIYEKLYAIYKKTNRFQLALKYFNKYHEMVLKLAQKKNSDKIAEMQIKFETEKKEKEAEVFRLKNIELEKKNKQIEHQKKELSKTIEKLRQSEIKFDVIESDLKKNIGLQLIGESTSIRDIKNLISVVAKSDNTNVLIIGESGTGKEIVARQIHAFSRRKKNNFFGVNTSAIPKTLFESEFFGYEKNAFTGADKLHIGWFEIAHKGTLFLDEIDTMQLDRQVKLLRVLEERKIVRLGSHKEIPVDVRIISATNTNLYDNVINNKFRSDLYHRLSTFVIQMPPLRERLSDIPLLTEHFVKLFGTLLNKKVTRIEQSVYTELMNYSFPGNVRELKNIVERAIIVSDSSTMKVKHFLIPKSQKIDKNQKRVLPLAQIEKNAIIEALKMTNNHITKAAELLQVERRALSRKMKKYNISK